MGIFDNVNQILGKAMGGDASEAEVHAAYDQVAQSVPPTTLADALSHAFKSDQTPAFPSMVANLFGQSNPEQKAGLLNTLLAKVDSSQQAEVLGSTPPAAGSVSPAQAQQITPEQAEKLAAHAERKDPTIIDQASQFYAQHPQLIKTIGAAAIGLMLGRMTAPRR